MGYEYLESTYKNLKIPVFVCKNTEGYPLVFANASAKLLVDPQCNIESMMNGGGEDDLTNLLVFDPTDVRDALFDTLQATGSVNDFKAYLLNYEGTRLSVSLTANWVELGGEELFVLYVYEVVQPGHFTATEYTTMLATAFQMALNAANPETTINQILAFIGSSVDVSRAYIFEDISPTTTSNTYEWCSEGIEPAIQDLQNLPKAEYNYDVIVNSGMYITDDVRKLPAGDRVILEAQGIKSLAILPLMQRDVPLGYVGFDDCEHYREWGSVEIDLLQNTANILVSLLARRNMDNQTNQTLNILQTITDNIDSVIYVNDIDTHELVFMNKALGQSLDTDPHELLGQCCWGTLQEDQRGPCSFCPMKKMLDEQGNVILPEYSWEFQNTRNGKWYLVKDSIIKWIDGRNVHIETATEITSQKVHEQELEQYASFDMMTGTYNREWGYRLLQEMLSSHILEARPNSLVFIDINDLKHVNDTYGHEVGDRMIIETVDVIRSCVRKSDVLCRWGGDEFLLLLQCGQAVATRIMNDVQKKMQEINSTSQNPYKLSVSYGITPLDMKGGNIDELIARADKLMYTSKLEYKKPALP